LTLKTAIKFKFLLLKSNTASGEKLIVLQLIRGPNIYDKYFLLNQVQDSSELQYASLSLEVFVKKINFYLSLNLFVL